jgi:hypothetical protein
MAKVQRRGDPGNGKGRSFRETGKEGRRCLLAELQQQLRSLEEASVEEHKERRNDLARFVRDLSVAERATLRRSWWKLPWEQQERLQAAVVNALGGILGPAETLLRELREDQEAWVDSLPEPPHKPERTFDDWLRILQRDGWSEDKAKEAAAKLSRSADDLMRDHFMELGATPEEAEVALATRRKSEKWQAAMDAMRSALHAAGERAKDDKHRRLSPEIAVGAEQAARDLAALVASPGGAAALIADDVSIPALLAAITRTILAGQPDAPSVLDDEQMFIVVRRPEDERLWKWHDVVSEAGDLAEAVMQGASLDLERVARVAPELAAIAKEARGLAAELERERGRPPKAALDAAEALLGHGLTWPQIAVMLDRHGLHLDPHTPENIRKSVQARRRRRDDGPPATK